MATHQDGTKADGKFSRLRDGQDIVLEQADPAVPIVVKKAKERGKHGFTTTGAKVRAVRKESAKITP